MDEIIDQPGEVRVGEELDAARLDRYLKSRIPSLRGEPTIQQFPGGNSNLTYRVRYPEQDLVLRRPPFGRKAAGAHDMGREYRVMEKLDDHYPVPKVLDHCEDESVMGAPFYVMERLRGLVLRRELPAGLSLDKDQARELGHRFIRLLAQLHDLDYRQCGLADLGKPDGYARRQIDGWIRRYQDAFTDDAPQIDDVTAWLDANLPDTQGDSLIHNDFRFDNLVLDPDTLEPLGVLDWEMATLGEPLMDLGNTLIYWIQADDPPAWHLNRMQPSHLPGMPTRREFADYYAELRGIQLPDLNYYIAYGYFRLGVILQQLYARWRAGKSQHPAHAKMLPAVHLCMQQAREHLGR